MSPYRRHTAAPPPKQQPVLAEEPQRVPWRHWETAGVVVAVAAVAGVMLFVYGLPLPILFAVLFLLPRRL